MIEQLTVSAKAAGISLPHFWSVCVGAGRANEGLRANWLEHLKLARAQCGFQYVRFHGLFHDDMFVCREQDGKRIYNFQYIDELFDSMLELGVRPFVELGFCPGAIASEKEDLSRQMTHKVEKLDSLEWKGVWIEDFLAFCVAEKLPLDFLSTHPYPTDFALDGHGQCIGRSRSVNSTRDDLRWLRRVIDGSPFPKAEIHLTEWPKLRTRRKR